MGDCSPWHYYEPWSSQILPLQVNQAIFQNELWIINPWGGYSVAFLWNPYSGWTFIEHITIMKCQLQSKHDSWLTQQERSLTCSCLSAGFQSSLKSHINRAFNFSHSSSMGQIRPKPKWRKVSSCNLRAKKTLSRHWIGYVFEAESYKLNRMSSVSPTSANMDHLLWTEHLCPLKMHMLNSNPMW